MKFWSLAMAVHQTRNLKDLTGGKSPSPSRNSIHITVRGMLSPRIYRMGSYVDGSRLLRLTMATADLALGFPTLIRDYDLLRSSRRRP